MSPGFRRLVERLGRIQADRRVQNAALIGSTFGMDPVAVLEEPDELKRLVRLAAHNHVHSVRKK